jgi:hypothetical protein
MFGQSGKKVAVAGLAAALLGAAGCTVETVEYDRHPRREVIVEEAPPPAPYVEEEVIVEPPPQPRYEIVPEPRPGFVWIRGEYVRRGRAYVWVGGRWGRIPEGRRHWVEARWDHGPRGWVRIEGHWE